MIIGRVVLWQMSTTTEHKEAIEDGYGCDLVTPLMAGGSLD
jgi:hypothetical protein